MLAGVHPVTPFDDEVSCAYYVKDYEYRRLAYTSDDGAAVYYRREAKRNEALGNLRYAQNVVLAKFPFLDERMVRALSRERLLIAIRLLRNLCAARRDDLDTVRSLLKSLQEKR